MASNHPSNDVTCQRVAILPGYVKADSRNLPKVDPLMIADYYQRLCNPPMKHVKLKSQLVMSIIGATKLKDTAAMQRGRELELKVLLELEKQIGCIKQSGVIFDRDLPVLGASPDGITSNGMAIVEVKCPTSEKSFRRYIKKDGTPAAKHVAQRNTRVHAEKLEPDPSNNPLNVYS
ncbi:hypothetical protein Pcinc_012333 [Petrolisthes cinctipes]|uniref:YqaJ viral recombinase domain-containing protein n=1 Tax=Petrolisthes cinctipes TaxID=88211 RepID=A0AAE1KRI5_PETCI|nr:hypothetical protein Pcinc_012333 [Petrolisthes cinctipes]